MSSIAPVVCIQKAMGSSPIAPRHFSKTDTLLRQNRTAVGQTLVGRSQNLLSSSRPSMRGFAWTKPVLGPSVPVVPGGDLWCVRDAFCELMGWPPESEDWQAFIPAPEGADTLRLIDHLGLEHVDPRSGQSGTAVRLAHPGILFYGLTIPSTVGTQFLSHAVYEPDLRNYRDIPPEYASYEPVLFDAIIDAHKPPRA